jgi:hypothetical protein
MPLPKKLLLLSGGSRMTSREEDPERNELRAMLTVSKGAAKHPYLHAAVHAVATRGQSQHTNIKDLGWWMQKRKGRVIDACAS